MDHRHRDGLLALVTCTLLIAISIQANEADTLIDSRVAVVGVGGALGVEAILHRYPALTRTVWERRWVQVAAAVSVVAIGLIAVRTARGTAVLGALMWGLLAYLGLLLVVEMRSRRNQS